jgi:nucleotide-binding universal stress UspA family protein
MTWKRIGCAVDFSPESRHALEQGALLATKYGAALTLVHVDDRSSGPPTDATLSGSVSLARGKLELERMLGEWTEEARRITSRAVEFLLLTGDPASELVKAAQLQPFDIVIMGTHGRAEVDRLTFGSVAQAVVRDAHCSVLVVRRPPT